MEPFIIFVIVLASAFALLAFISLAYQKGIEDERARLFWEDGFSAKEATRYEQQLKEDLIKIELGLKKKKK